MGIRKYIKRRRENKKELEPVPPPDGGWGWVVCAAAFLIQFIVLGTMNNFGILYVKLFDDFGQKAFLTCKILLFMLVCIFKYAPVALREVIKFQAKLNFNFA